LVIEITSRSTESLNQIAHIKIMSSDQTGSSFDAPPHADAASEAKSVQNAWGRDRALGAPHTRLPVTLSKPFSPTSDLIPQPVAAQTGTTEPDDEFGDFVTASTDPLKRPIYEATDERDETQGLLNHYSAPVWESDTYIGMGIVEPVIAGIGTSKQTVLRARKLAGWKLNGSRAGMILEEHKRKRLQMMENTAVSGKTDSNKYIETPRTVPSALARNGVMRPVSFTEPAIDELMETERKVWGP
jgi:hypothetical protein